MAANKKNTKNNKNKTEKRRITQLPGIKLAAFVVISGTLILAGLLIYFSLQSQAPVVPKPTVQKIRISTFEDVNRLVEDELLSSQASEGWRRIDSSNDSVRLQMYGDYPEQLRLMELATRIALTDSPAQLDLAPRKGLVRVYWHGELRMELLYKVSEEIRKRRPRVAIVMDDMGRNLEGFKAILGLDIPITPSILPQTSFASRGAKILQDNDHEYMIHLPMEPKNYPSISPGKNALLVSLSKEQIKNRVKDYLDTVPGAIGGNNHMGSRFTQNRPAMRAVLEELKDSGFFFIDSRTIGGSVAFDEARKMAMETGVRNIFLDNEENVSYISGQLRKMVRVAEEKGMAIAICHPYPETFEALRKNRRWLQAQNIDFVLASRVVKRY